MPAIPSKSVAPASGNVLSGLWSRPILAIRRNIDQLMKMPPGRLFVKMSEDNAFNWAVIIAWNFLQSLFPMALVMAAVLGVGLASIGVGSHQVYGTIASIIPTRTPKRRCSRR